VGSLLFQRGRDANAVPCQLCARSYVLAGKCCA